MFKEIKYLFIYFNFFIFLTLKFYFFKLTLKFIIEVLIIKMNNININDLNLKVLKNNTDGYY